MAGKTNIDYHIKCITPSDYELEFKLPVDNKTFLILFNKAKEKLLRERGLKVGEADPELINSFEVPPIYYKFLKVTIKKIYNNARQKFQRQGIELMNYDVTKTKFIRNKSNNWDVRINITGIYADKR